MIYNQLLTCNFVITGLIIIFISLTQLRSFLSFLKTFFLFFEMIFSGHPSFLWFCIIYLSSSPCLLSTEHVLPNLLGGRIEQGQSLKTHSDENPFLVILPCSWGIFLVMEDINIVKLKFASLSTLSIKSLWNRSGRKNVIGKSLKLWHRCYSQ